jgi:hypothetical protein
VVDNLIEINMIEFHQRLYQSSIVSVFFVIQIFVLKMKRHNFLLICEKNKFYYKTNVFRIFSFQLITTSLYIEIY